MTARRVVGYVAQAVIGGLIALFLGAPCVAGTEWGSPHALWLLIPVLLLPLQPLGTGKNALAVPKVGRRPWSARVLIAWIPDVLRIAGLALFVVALARPQITRRQEVVESPGLDILLAIDTSGSMEIDDMRTSYGQRSRLQVAKGVAKEFVEARPHDRIGVVVFGETAFTWVPLTLDHDTLEDALSNVEIGMSGSRGTAVGTAIAVSSKRMMKLEAPDRIVILVTDGQSNAGRISPVEAAQIAGALGIRVYTIGVGGPGEDGVDEPMMTAVAKLTGGRYFRATDMRALEGVYAQIDELETSPAKVRDLIQHDERFACPLTKGALLLLIAALLSATVLRRGP